MGRKRTLSRDEWSQFAGNLKAAKAALWRAVEAVQETAPASDVDRIIRVMDRIDVIKCDLEAHAGRQHPQWGPPHGVFFGVDAGRGAPLEPLEGLEPFSEKPALSRVSRGQT